MEILTNLEDVDWWNKYDQNKEIPNEIENEENDLKL